MRLSWARKEPDPVPEAASSPAPVDRETRAFELAAVDLTTTEGRWSGWIATDGERTSDWLNHGAEVVVHGMSEVALDAGSSDPGLPVDGLQAHRLRPAEIVFVVPPPLPPNRHLRLHRRRVRIVLEMGDYQVSGQLHVRPGAQAGDYVLRSSRTMVPLTDVELVHTGEPEFRRLMAVLIINTRFVTSMEEGEARSGAAPAPEPAPVPLAVAPQRAAPDAGSMQRINSALGVLRDAGLLTAAECAAKQAEMRSRGST